MFYHKHAVLPLLIVYNVNMLVVNVLKMLSS
jgi:hypothetical protein